MSITVLKNIFIHCVKVTQASYFNLVLMEEPQARRKIGFVGLSGSCQMNEMYFTGALRILRVSLMMFYVCIAR